MSLDALLIVLMAGTEIFRPLRDLRSVLHQGLNGQAAAAGINAADLRTSPDAPSFQDYWHRVWTGLRLRCAWAGPIPPMQLRRASGRCGWRLWGLWGALTWGR